MAISSMYYDKEIDDVSVTNESHTTTFYNKTKFGVDLVDQLCQNYDVARNLKRWPMLIFL